MTHALRIGLILWCTCHLAACSSSGAVISWREEVRLNDDRTIVIEHKERCDPGYSGKNHELCIAREHWVTLDLPDFSPVPIVWHQDLFPVVINIDAGKLYVVGYPRTGYEDNMSGNPKPPYIGFVWQDGQWKHIPFGQIPTAIYDTNVFTGNAFTDNEVLTVKRKEGSEGHMRGNPMTVAFLKRIDPSLK